MAHVLGRKTDRRTGRVGTKANAPPPRKVGAARPGQGGFSLAMDDQGPRMKTRRSALTMSGWVVAMPCG